MASDLRYLCAAQLYIKADLYASHVAFVNDGEFGMSLSESAENVFVSTQDREAAIRHEALETCNIIPRPKWSCLIHMLALADVIQRPVFSVYPADTGFPYRHLFHRRFHPHGELLSPTPIYILWSVDGCLPNGPFNPNHFVAVVLNSQSHIPDTGPNTARNGDTFYVPEEENRQKKKRTSKIHDFFKPKKSKTDSKCSVPEQGNGTSIDNDMVHSDTSASSEAPPIESSDVPQIDPSSLPNTEASDIPPTTPSDDPPIPPSDVPPTAPSAIPSTPSVIKTPLCSFESPNQPKDFNFPKRSFGKDKVRRRQFQSQWFEQFTWLHYNEQEDKAYCHSCAVAYEKNMITSGNADPAFISSGFSNWNDAKRILTRHGESNCHKEAIQRLSLERGKSQVDEMLVGQLENEKEKNRQSLLKIVSNIKFLARQGLALRGADNDTDSNFNQLNKLRSQEDPDFEKWLHRKTNRYTSPEIQNEILSIMSDQIIRGLASDIRNSNFFAIMADETTDISNRQQLVVCLRWIDENLQAHEDLIGLYKIDNTQAVTIAESIKDVLMGLNINLEKCRGQTYDGASAMSGHKSGVQQRIKELQPKALYNHCHGHLLNLACADNIKQNVSLSSAMDTVYEITKLIKKSPQRDTQLEQLRKDASTDVDRPNSTIRVLCPTRWTVKADAFLSIINNYDILHDLWDWSLQVVKDSDMKARIRGVQAHMKKFEFFFGASLAEVLLRNADNLSKALQSKDLSAAESKSIAMKTVQTLKSMRDNQCFTLFWENVTMKATQRSVEEPVLPRRRKMPSRFETGSAPAEFHSTAKDYFRQKYFEAVDHIVTAITDRFDQKDFDIYVNTEQILLKCVKGIDYSEELKLVCSFYQDDVHEATLVCQLRLLATVFETNAPREEVLLKDVIAFLRGMTPRERVLLSDVVTLLKLVLVLPATNATSERSFSTLRRIKTYLRSTMKQDRLNDLMVLHVHKARTDNLDFKRVASEFAFKEHRVNIFGKFE